jgi:hypothetical protein
MNENAPKITKRDNYNALYDLVSNAGLDQETEERLHAFIDHELELMAQRAEKSKKYQQAHKATDDAMTDAIMEVLRDADAPMTVADIVGKVIDSTPQKVVYRLGKLFKDNSITKETKSVKVGDNPARKVTFYTVA